MFESIERRYKAKTKHVKQVQLRYSNRTATKKKKSDKILQGSNQGPQHNHIPKWWIQRGGRASPKRKPKYKIEIL